MARHGWESVFWVNLPLCLLVALVVVPTPAVVPSHRRRLDVAGTVLSAALLGFSTYAVVLAGRFGWTWSVAGFAAAALVAGVLLVAVERRSPDPLLPGALLRDRRFGGGLLGAFGASLAVFVLLVFVSLFLQLVQEQGAQETGWVLLPLPAALVVTALAAGRWHALAVPVLAGLLVAGVALVVLGLRLSQQTSGTELRVLLAVVGAGVGLTTAPVVTAALTAAGEARAGLAAAGVNVARELGGVVAVAGLGALAVAQLSRELTRTLTAGDVPAAQQPDLLDALLGARTEEVRALLLERIGLEGALKLNGTLKAAATESFVSSTSTVLVAAGGLLVALAVLSGWLLRPTRTS